MQQDVNEKLSMLMDDELNLDEAVELLDQIETDDNLRADWARYCSVHEVLQGNRLFVQGDSFVSSVSAALEDEPTILMPSRRRKISAIELPLTARNWKSGIAVAASVAALALFIGHGAKVDPIDVNSTDTLAEIVTPGDKMQQLASVDESTELAASDSSNDSRFSDYLATHNETAYSVGAQGILPYARFVNYQVDQ